MTVIPIPDPQVDRARQAGGMVFLSGGFRPFFLGAASWAAIGVPIWLAAYAHGYAIGGALPAALWHAHEMVYGFAFATVAGFLLTAIPNWTGRLPVRGAPLGALALLWLAGRIALLGASPLVAAAVDLAFPVALIAVVARELIAGRNYRNLPMLGALGVLFAGNLLMHLHALDVAYTGPLGAHLGVATLLALVALVGGRIIPSFTGNWLVKLRRDVPRPAPVSRLDLACLLVTVAGLIAWVLANAWPILTIAGGVAAAIRLSRWRGLRTLREPLLVVLHVGYAWLAFALVFAGVDALVGTGLSAAALHAMTVGTIGTMTLAVMTRASLGHSGQPLHSGAGTSAIYVLVNLAAVLRILGYTITAGVAWTAAFALFALLYGPLLIGKKQ